jgi:hypothetical protein
VPDEIEVVPEGAHSQNYSAAGPEDRPLSPRGSPIPRTVVEKVDPSEPSYGEVPGTQAHEKRLADAVPDVVTKASDLEGSPTPPALDPTSPQLNISETVIPETRLERVDTLPADEDVPSHPQAHQSSPSDTLPDTVETVPDVSLSNYPEPPVQDLSLEINANEYDEYDEQEEGEAGDDFDEFVEEQDDMEDDDFGDFDDGFQEPSTEDADEPPADGIASQHNAPPVVRAHT